MATKETVGVMEAARQLGTTVEYIYSRLGGGFLKASKADGVWVIEKDSVLAYRQSHPLVGSKRRAKN